MNHPSLIKGLGHDKQGFTLYSLLDQRVRNPLGKRLLRQWIRSPLNNQKEIESRHDVIEFYQQPQLKELKVSLEKEMVKVCELPTVCKRICRYQERMNDWFHIIDSFSAILEIGRINEVMIHYSSMYQFYSFFINRQTTPELIQLAPSLMQSQEIKQCHYLLQQVFDYSQSVQLKELVIRNGVDVSLDDYRKVYESMSSILEECTLSTRHELISSFHIQEEQMDSWGYEFLPRSQNSFE